MKALLVTGCLLLLGVTGCGGGGGSSSNAAVGGGPPPPPLPPPPPISGFATLDDGAWNDTAVRKVLSTFAYGGHAGDQQISSWADMAPTEAIREMLTFDEHNLKLSPTAADNTDGLAQRAGTLAGLREFWMSDDPANGVNPDLRQLYQFSLLVWYRAALSRGLNPFRQKLGLWETNYHAATNRRVGVTGDQSVRYYDDMMRALAADQPYRDILSIAALSAAVARQYGHFENRYINGMCRCNEDFAREYHQLLFGILGDYDSFYHETVTVKNTAAALTDMRLDYDPVAMQFVDELFFGRFYHTPGPLDILQMQIGGNDAEQRINQLSAIAIEHPESLDNLPIKIIAGLADDNLSQQKIDVIRAAWAGMNDKDLLGFLQSYAISESLHSADRIKYYTSVDRLFLIANGVLLNNEESYLDINVPYDIQNEDVQVFAPRHNVFGAQTGLEAADSTEVFRNNFNRVTREFWRIVLPAIEQPGVSWEKDWGAVVPADAGGDYVVQEIAEWLWQRFIGDGLQNFGTLERAHLYAFLATDFDLVYTVNRDEIETAGLDPDDISLYDFDRIVTTAELENDQTLIDLIDGLATDTIALDDADQGIRRNANARVGQAINFVVATPYMFAQEGR